MQFLFDGLQRCSEAIGRKGIFTHKVHAEKHTQTNTQMQTHKQRHIYACTHMQTCTHTHAHAHACTLSAVSY